MLIWEFPGDGLKIGIIGLHASMVGVFEIKERGDGYTDARMENAGACFSVMSRMDMRRR